MKPLTQAPAAAVLVIASCSGMQSFDSEEDGLSRSQDRDSSEMASAPATVTLTGGVARAEPDPSKMSTTVDDLNDFSWRFFSAARSQDNFVSSPISLSIAWSMLSTAAEGQTLDEIRSVLQGDSARDSLHEGSNALLQALALRNRGGSESADPQSLLFSNHVWVDSSVSPDSGVLDQLALYYGAGVEASDFRGQPEQVRQQINNTVSADTNGVIEELLSNEVITQDTMAVVTNAVYFSGRWATPFETSAEPISFSSTNGNSTAVPAMTQLVFPEYHAGENFTALALPYNGFELEMVLVVPDAGQFETVVGAVSADWARDLRGQMEQTAMHLELPKSSVQWESELTSTLRSMGISSAFEVDAELDDLRPDLFVTDVIHAARVSVDEEGSEAAAATAIVMASPPGAPVVQVSFSVDRPFLFWIRDRDTQATLFVGQVLSL